VATIKSRFHGEDFVFQNLAAPMIQQNRFMQVQSDAVTGSMLDAGLIGDLTPR
jgi:hypothetical protein